MAYSTKATSLLLLLSLACFISLPFSIAASSNVSAVFSFGDSTLDAGNNNHLGSILFRADHSPYGRDLPRHVPTGRFSNGKLSTDYISHFLGLRDLLPAYFDPSLTEHDLLTGVSFASGGSGLDNLTTDITRVLDLGTQFQLFEKALQRIRRYAGEEKARNVVEKALFMISIGTNDMLYNEYLLPTRMIQHTLSGYQDFLIHNLESFIERLYNAGARRIAVAGLPPIGCLPLQVTVNSIKPWSQSDHRLCNNHQNRDSEAYNSKLKSQIHSLAAKLHHSKIAYFDIYTPILDMVKDPSKYGFQRTLEGCCGTGLMEMGPLCNGLDITCRDPSKFLFWEDVHLTQAGYFFLADNARKTALQHLIN